jgi:hypothetical protein
MSAQRRGVQHHHMLGRGQRDHARLPQVGKGAADRFGADAEEIGDVGPAHRQVERETAILPAARAAQEHHKERGHPLARGFPAQRHQVVLHGPDLPQRRGGEKGRVGRLPRLLVGQGGRDDGERGRSERVAIGGPLALDVEAHDVARIAEAHDLLLPRLGHAGQAQHPFDHAEDSARVVALMIEELPLPEPQCRQAPARAPP